MIVLLAAPKANEYYEQLGFQHNPRAWVLARGLGGGCGGDGGEVRGSRAGRITAVCRVKGEEEEPGEDGGEEPDMLEGRGEGEE